MHLSLQNMNIPGQNERVDCVHHVRVVDPGTRALGHDLEVDGVVHQVALQYLRHQRVHVLLVEVVAEQGEDGGAAEVHARVAQVTVDTYLDT